MHPRDHDRDGGLVSLRIAAGAYPLGARARSHWRARYASISVHETRCDAYGNSRMVREPLVHRKQHSRSAARISASKLNGNGPTSLSRERRRRCSECSPSLHFGWRIPKSPSAFARDPPPGITNANLHSVMPSPPSEGCSGARRVFQCLGIPRTMWKFQPPSWKDLPTRYATPRKIPKVELFIPLNA